MVSAGHFAQVAESSKYDSWKYADHDCQDYVECVLYDSGVRKPDGSRYNWRGSNSMWRSALSWKGTIAEAVEKFGQIPPGSWAFMVKNDGGEKERGYDDGEGNATHVGIYIDGCRVRDSTRSTKTKRDGVGYRSVNDFNMIGLCKYLDYNVENVNNNNQIKSILDDIENKLREIRRLLL